MEEAVSAQRREIENNPRQNDTNLISTDIHLDKVRKRYFGALYRNVPKQTTRVEQKKSKEILIE
jgi:hypothetical protein